jgi:kumamolisin
MEASILVRRRPQAGELDAILSGEAPRLSREEAAATLGANTADLERVIAFVRSQGLTVVESNAAKRTVRVSGTVSQIESAFGITLQFCGNGGQLYICYDGVLSIPAALEGIIVAVLGLDQRPVARHR